MKHLKKTIILSIWLLIFVGYILSFRISDEMELLYSTISLRYNIPLSSSQVSKARDYSDSVNNQYDILQTFWAEQNVDIQTEYKTISAKNIIYLGDGNRAYNAEFISGWYPSESDPNGCVVSDTIAWNLWESTDIIGQKLSYNEQEFLVRGIFKDSKSIVMNCADDEFTAVELYIANNVDVSQYFSSFAIASGLGEPYQVANGTDIVGLAKAICFTPVIFAMILLLIELIKTSRNFKKSTQQILWFSLALITTIFLPNLLLKIPEWMLPTMWSDFSFWGSLLQTIKNKTMDWFSLVPTVKDVSVKFLLLFQVTISSAMCIAIYHVFILYFHSLISCFKRSISSDDSDLLPISEVTS